MSKGLERRVQALETGGGYATIGALLDLLDVQKAGEHVDWSKVRVNPELVRTLDEL